MQRMPRILIGAAALLATASVANASVIWRGDFETGDIHQWPKKEMMSADRLQTVTSPVAQGKFALKTTVRRGDNPIGASGLRNELVYRDDKPKEGDDRYYRWQTMFPEDFKAGDWYQIFVQWHQYVSGGSPPLAFMVMGEEIKLGSLQKYFFSIPLERGSWHDWVAHVRWSSDPNVGGVEVWYDGKLILPFTHWATLFPNDTVYLKQGLYRKALIDWEQVVYHDGMVVGTELDDVWPRTPTEQDPQPNPGEITAAGTSGLGEGPASPEAMQARAQMGCQSIAGAWMMPALLVALLLMSRRRLAARAVVRSNRRD